LNSSMDTQYLLTGSDSLPADTEQYQHVAITLRSRQLLKMGTWLPETCWVSKREIKENTKVTSSWFLIHTELRCTVNHTSDISLVFLQCLQYNDGTADHARTGYETFHPTPFYYSLRNIRYEVLMTASWSASSGMWVLRSGRRTKTFRKN